MNLNQIENIIWDWNGTLLNDVETCINCMNKLLITRNLPELELKRYREVFTFPVQDYYERIGIDFKKDPFNIIGHQFMDLYFEGLKTCDLHDDAKVTLQEFENLGKKQFILSAMEQNALVDSLDNFNISGFFNAVFGIDNHLAAGKIERGIQMIQVNHIETEKTIMIGDTLHDLDVAQKLGVHCVIVSRGHQSKSRLQSSGIDVFDNFSELISKLR